MKIPAIIEVVIKVRLTVDNITNYMAFIEVIDEKNLGIAKKKEVYDVKIITYELPAYCDAIKTEAKRFFHDGFEFIKNRRLEFNKITQN